MSSKNRLPSAGWNEGHDEGHRLAPYKFNTQIEKETRKLYALDNWHGIVACAQDYAVVALVVALFYRSRGLVQWVVYICIVLPVVGARMRGLGTMLHEAAHRTLARSSWLNRLLGTYASGYLILQSWSSYKATHVKEHHPYLAHAERDPDFRGNIEAGMYDCETAREFRRKYVFGLRLLLRVPLMIRNVARDRLMAPSTSILQRLGVITYFGATLFAASALVGSRTVILCWLVPLFVAFPLVNWYAELLEHFPLIADASSELHATRHRSLGLVGHFLLGIHNEGFHLDHHLTQRIPFWNLPRVHLLRLKDPRYAAAVAHGDPTGTFFGQLKVICGSAPRGLRPSSN